MELEDCPICWRNFSMEVIPICLQCGHSCCRDCSTGIRSCALCRHKITANFQRNPNYSLMAIIERTTRSAAQQRSEQGTQTDEGLLAAEAPPGRNRKTRPSMMDGKAMTVAIKRTGIELIFK